MHTALSLLALAAPLVSAIQFEEPVANATLSKGQTYNVKWSSVDTDPSHFSIYLVNFVDWPPFYTQLASEVETSSGEHEVTVPCNVDSSWGFQFNAINGTNVYVIHAQTPKFFVEDGACSGEAPPLPTDVANPTCEPTTVTETATATAVTVTVTDSSCPSTTSAPDTSDSDSDSDSETEHPGNGTEGPSDNNTGADTTVAAQPPAVTNPPQKGGEGAGHPVTYSTVYTTVYKDMSEVQCCKQ